MDELVALTDAAARAGRAQRPRRSASTATGDDRDQVAELLAAAGMRPSAIAAELGLAKSTVNYHARRLGASGPRPTPAGARSCATLGCSGVRVSELCDLRIRDVRLHDPGGARFHIPDAKTEAGIREVR